MSSRRIELEDLPPVALVELGLIIRCCAQSHPVKEAEKYAQEVIDIVEGCDSWFDDELFFANIGEMKNGALVQRIDTLDDNLESSDGVDTRNYTALILTRSGFTFQLYCYRNDNQRSMMINNILAYPGEDYDEICRKEKSSYLQEKISRVIKEVMGGSTPMSYVEIEAAYTTEIESQPQLLSQRQAQCVQDAIAASDGASPVRPAISRAGIR